MRDKTVDLLNITELLQSISTFIDIHACQNYTLIKSQYADIFKKIRYDDWICFDFHNINQTWGNTSRGWQTIGGSAMSSGFTVIIEHKQSNSAWIFYNGKLAYICVMDENYQKYQSNLSALPGKESAYDKLTLINV